MVIVFVAVVAWISKILRFTTTFKKKVKKNNTFSKNVITFLLEPPFRPSVFSKSSKFIDEKNIHVSYCDFLYYIPISVVKSKPGIFE